MKTFDGGTITTGRGARRGRIFTVKIRNEGGWYMLEELQRKEIFTVKISRETRSSWKAKINIEASYSVQRIGKTKVVMDKKECFT